MGSRPPPLRLISADVVAPMVGDLFWRNAGVVVREADGRIVAAGPVGDLIEQLGDLPREHLAGVMLPGLVNAHTHLELGYQPRQTDGPLRFTEWVAAIMKQYPSAAELEAMVAKAVHAGVRESLAAGVTCIGDISRHCAITRRELANSPLRVVSFGEVVGLGKMRQRAEPMLGAATDPRFASPTLTIGVSPHAPYTVEGPALAQIARRAVAGNMPMSMHLAELSEEALFLKDLSGPLGRDWDVMLKLDVIDAAIPLSPNGPVHWAKQWGLLGKQGAASRVPMVLAHVNYASAECAILHQSGASVAYCPRTRLFFGHDRQTPHPYRDMLAAGVNVCLGTDSLASNPDLSVLREAHVLWQRDRLSAVQAMEMITWRGARALGLRAGQLAAGSLADVAVFPLATRAGDSLEEILGRVLHEAPPASAAWVGARRAL